MGSPASMSGPTGKYTPAVRRGANRNSETPDRRNPDDRRRARASRHREAAASVAGSQGDERVHVTAVGGSLRLHGATMLRRSDAVDRARGSGTRSMRSAAHRHGTARHGLKLGGRPAPVRDFVDEMRAVGDPVDDSTMTRASLDGCADSLRQSYRGAHLPTDSGRCFRTAIARLPHATGRANVGDDTPRASR